MKGLNYWSSFMTTEKHYNVIISFYYKITFVVLIRRSLKLKGSNMDCCKNLVINSVLELKKVLIGLEMLPILPSWQAYTLPIF